MIKLIILLSLCSLALSLQCYDCKPEHTNGCKTPAIDSIQTTSCEENEECFSLYFEAEKQNSSGIYRGCASPPENSCDYKLPVNGVVKSCTRCTEDECNYGSPGGAASMTISAITLTLSAVCFYFLNF